MARQLLLHIGMTKTGSTSVQSLLNANRAPLLAQGICYPATPHENRHILLATAFTSYPDVFNDTDDSLWQGARPDVAVAEYLARLQAELASLPGDVTKIIISAEQFSMCQRTQADIGRLYDFLRPFASEIKVIVYLRRQDEHFASLYSQFLRLGNVHQPSLDQLQPFHHDYDYVDVVARWAGVFGEAAMVPRIFERSAGKPFDVLADFAEICGIDLSRLDTGNGERNQSMNSAGQEALRMLGSLIQDKTGTRTIGGPVWRRVSEAVTAASPGRGWQPTQAQAHRFVECYAASNESVRARWFPERASLFSQDYTKLPVDVASVAGDAIAQAAAAAFLLAMELGVKREVKLTLAKARLAHKAGDARLRRVTLAQAVRLDGKNAICRLRLAECLADEGDMRSALTQLGIAAQLAPETPGLGAVQRRLARHTIKPLNASQSEAVQHGCET